MAPVRCRAGTSATRQRHAACSVTGMPDLADDLRLAVRHWIRRPWLPTAVVAILAAGLGAALAVFAVAWAVVWRPFDAPQPHQLVWVESASSGEADGSSPGAALTWQAEARTLDGVVAIRSVAGAFADDRGADRLAGALVSWSIGPVLGVQPVLGRTFSAADDTPGAPRVVLVSHATWRSRYGSASDVVGRDVTLDGRAATIVGVLPAAATDFVPGAAWWAPLALAPSERANVGPRYLAVMARRREGVSMAAAREELAAISARIGAKADDGSLLDVRVTALGDHLTRRYRRGLQLLLAGISALVLIACANAASLLLTRTRDRQAEFALRASLGATRARITRQLLVEAALLSAVASAGGLLAAWWLIDLLRGVLPADVPRLADARVDGATAMAALAAGALVTLVAGLAPALRGARVDLQLMLRSAAAGSRRPERVHRAFVAAQVALAVVLACAGALLVQTAAALETAPRGYEAQGVVTTSLTLPAATYRDAPGIASVVDRVIAGLGRVPGIRGAAAASHVPFAGGSAGSDVAFAGEAFTDGVDRQARVRLVSAHYLRTLGVPVLDGRDIGAEDGATTRPVAVVNEILARRLASGASVVGRDLTFGVPVFNGPDGRRVWQVVGVAANSRDRGPREDVEPEVLIPVAQAPADVFFWISRELQLAVRADGDPRAVIPEVRRVVAAIDPMLPLGVPLTLEERRATAFARERLMARLLAAAGGAGVLLALVGLVASIHEQVRRQRRDIAIRLAVGATVPTVVSQLVTSGTRVAVVGAVAGAAISAGTGGWLASLLFGVSPGDPVTRLAVAGSVIALAAAAAWLPARRAADVDPAEALRAQ